MRGGALAWAGGLLGVWLLQGVSGVDRVAVGHLSVGMLEGDENEEGEAGLVEGQRRWEQSRVLGREGSTDSAVAVVMGDPRGRRMAA